MRFLALPLFLLFLALLGKVGAVDKVKVYIPQLRKYDWFERREIKRIWS